VTPFEMLEQSHIIHFLLKDPLPLMEILDRQAKVNGKDDMKKAHVFD
jgi:hypothetical protein